MENAHNVKVSQQSLSRQERVAAMLDRVDLMSGFDRNRIRIHANKLHGLFGTLEQSAMAMHDVNFDLLEDLSLSLPIGHQEDDRAAS